MMLLFACDNCEKQYILIYLSVCQLLIVFCLLWESSSEVAIERCIAVSVRNWREKHLHDVEAAEAAGVSAGPGGLHQGRAKEPQEGVPACSGGSEADSECPAGYWSVPWSRRSEQRHCWLNNRYERRVDRTTLLTEFFDSYNYGRHVVAVWLYRVMQWRFISLLHGATKNKPVTRSRMQKYCNILIFWF